MYDVCGVGNMF